jgi:hypothetical protein
VCLSNGYAHTRQDSLSRLWPSTIFQVSSRARRRTQVMAGFYLHQGIVCRGCRPLQAPGFNSSRPACVCPARGCAGCGATENPVASAYWPDDHFFRKHKEGSGPWVFPVQDPRSSRLLIRLAQEKLAQEKPQPKSGLFKGCDDCSTLPLCAHLPRMMQLFSAEALRCKQRLARSTSMAPLAKVPNFFVSRTCGSQQ